MNPTGLFERIYRPLLAIAALIIIFFALKAMTDLVTTLLLALLITIVVTPFQAWFEHHGLSRKQSMISVMLLVTLVFIIFFLTLFLSMSNLIETLSVKQAEVQLTVKNLLNDLTARSLEISTAPVAEQASRSLGSLITILKSVADNVSNAVVILIVFVLMYLDAGRVPMIVRKRFPGNPVVDSFGMYSQNVRGYIINTTIVNLVIAGLALVVLVVLRVPNPVAWGLVIFILKFVPVVGLWLALIPLTLVTLLISGLETAVLVFICLALIDGLTSNTLYYRLMGTGLNLSPAAIFVSILFWSFVLGPLGAFLALPLTMLVKTFVLDDDAQMLSEIISYSSAEPPAEEVEALET